MIEKQDTLKRRNNYKIEKIIEVRENSYSQDLMQSVSQSKIFVYEQIQEIKISLKDNIKKKSLYKKNPIQAYNNKYIKNNNNNNNNLKKNQQLMNIQSLLKTIDYKNMVIKKQLLTPQAAYKLKTSQSIGTLSSIGDQHQHSFIINDIITPSHHNNNINHDKFKLDNQLFQIDMMKHLYQSRQVTNKIKNKCLQMSQSKTSKSQKSLEKHLLKPSNIPNFSKVSHYKTINDKNDKNYQKIYSENFNNNSQISTTNYISNNSHKGNIDNNQIIYQYPTLSTPLLDQHKQRNQNDHPIHISQQTVNIIGNLVNSQKSSMQNTYLSQNKKYSNSHRYRLVQDTPPNPVNKFQSCYGNCLTKDQISNIFEQYLSRVIKLQKKVKQLLQQNKKLKQNVQYIKNQGHKNTKLLLDINKSKIITENQLKKQIQQKISLEKILKDVLYTKEKNKLYHSKQNSFRESQKNLKKSINFSFVNNQSGVQLKSRNSVGKHSQSKLKVQNLLNKLQVKANKS